MATENISNNYRSQILSNNQLFNVIVYMNNHTKKQYQLPTAHIVELVVEEDLLNWPYKGYIIYSNKYEGIERNEDPDAWFYRMDARDELNLKIQLVSDDPAEEPLPKNTWEMDLDFVIYDTKDIPSPNIQNKFKKIYFWDKKYQMMQDKKITWSTSSIQKEKLGLNSIAHLSDNYRYMLTGDAIKELITRDDGAGYSDGIDIENWDTGSNRIFYTSPCTNNIIDDINELLDDHISEIEKDVSILKYNNRVEKKFQLIPMHKFFDNAGNDPKTPGKWQLEHFFFEDVESEENITTPYRSPYKEDLSFEVDIKIGEWNKITTYEFIDMSGIDNTKALVSKPVYSYSFKDGSFNMDYTENEIENVKSEFKRLYTDKLLPAGKATPIFTLNKTKKDQYNISPEFVFNTSNALIPKENRVLYGKCKILFGGLFLNEFIKFRVIGSPHRTIGKFIGIDRRTSDEKLDFDNKICGQWFITNVKHIWNHNRYVNDICAVKVHMYNDNGVIEDID